MRELSEMPARYIHIIYKEYVTMLQDEKKKQAHESENMVDELADHFGK